MRSIVHPDALTLYVLAWGDRRCGTYDGDKVTVPTDFDPEDAEAGLLAIERHALHGTGQVFCGVRTSRGLRTRVHALLLIRAGEQRPQTRMDLATSGVHCCRPLEINAATNILHRWAVYKRHLHTTVCERRCRGRRVPHPEDGRHEPSEVQWCGRPWCSQSEERGHGNVSWNARSTASALGEGACAMIQKACATEARDRQAQMWKRLTVPVCDCSTYAWALLDDTLCMCAEPHWRWETNRGPVVRIPRRALPCLGSRQG